MAVIGRDALVTEIANQLHCTQTMVRAVISKTEELISDALTKGDKVQFTGFGTFEMKHYAARLGRNPKKPDQTFEVPARDVPTFKAGKLLLEKIEQARNAVKKKSKRSKK